MNKVKKKINGVGSSSPLLNPRAATVCGNSYSIIAWIRGYSIQDLSYSRIRNSPVKPRVGWNNRNTGEHQSSTHCGKTHSTVTWFKNCSHFYPPLSLKFVEGKKDIDDPYRHRSYVVQINTESDKAYSKNSSDLSCFFENYESFIHHAHLNRPHRNHMSPD